MKQHDVVSVCNALMDILIQVDDSDLKTLSLTKGIMHLVDSKRQQEVFAYFQDKPHFTELGGSSLNAMRTLRHWVIRLCLPFCQYDDHFGTQIKRRMNDLGIKAPWAGIWLKAQELASSLLRLTGEAHDEHQSWSQPALR